jgi:subtilisin family serine protease
MDVRPSGDTLALEASSNGVNWTPLSRHGRDLTPFRLTDFRLRRRVTAELPDHLVQRRVRFRLHWVSQEGSLLGTEAGTAVDNFEVRCPATRYPRNRDRRAFLYLSGTSFAVPYVAGAAALYRARFPRASVAVVKRALLRGVDPDRHLRGKVRSGGRLNLFKTLTIEP